MGVSEPEGLYVLNNTIFNQKSNILSCRKQKQSKKRILLHNQKSGATGATFLIMLLSSPPLCLSHLSVQYHARGESLHILYAQWFLFQADIS